MTSVVEGDTDGEEPPDRLLAAVAVVVLWCGRVLLVAAPLVVVWSALAREAWSSAPLDDAGFSTHWLPNTAIFLSLVWGISLPALILPVAPSALASHSGRDFVARTVLGRRTVRLPARRLTTIRLPDRGGGPQLLVITGRRGFCIVSASDGWSAQYPALRAVRKTAHQRRSYGVAFSILPLIVWIAVGCFLGAIGAGLAGAI